MFGTPCTKIVQLVQIFTCCSHNASASLTQGVTPLFHLGLATTSPLHYLSLWIFVTFDLLPPSLWVAFEFSHFWTPTLSIVLLFSYQSLTRSLLQKSPKSQNHCCLLLTFSSPPIIATGPLNLFWFWSQCDIRLASLIWPFLLRFSHLYLIHYSLTFAEDHFGLSRPFLFLTRSHISSLWSLSFDLAEDEIHNSGCRQNQPIIRSERISWSLSDDERKIALHLRP